MQQLERDQRKTYETLRCHVAGVDVEASQDFLALRGKRRANATMGAIKVREYRRTLAQKS